MELTGAGGCNVLMCAQEVLDDKKTKARFLKAGFVVSCLADPRKTEIKSVIIVFFMILHMSCVFSLGIFPAMHAKLREQNQ